MAKKNRANHDDERRESGEPGGGQGRRDEVGGSGVYPRSAENIPGDAVIRTPQQWGQGERGAEGYEDSGGSELLWQDGQLLGGLTSDPSGRPAIDIHGGDRPEQHQTEQRGKEQSGEAQERSTEDSTSETRRGSPRRGPRVSRRTMKRDKETTQLLERGEGHRTEEQVDPGVDSPSEITIQGGPGTDASYRFGGPLSEPGEPPNPRLKGTGGEGGYSTLGGGVYPDEGSSEDAPHYGDWQRHSSGASSGARGQEGLSFPGEQTWGEEQDITERQEEQGSSPIGRPAEIPAARRESRPRDPRDPDSGSRARRDRNQG